LVTAKPMVTVKSLVMAQPLVTPQPMMTVLPQPGRKPRCLPSQWPSSLWLPYHRRTDPVVNAVE
jgi:hypothetical protein